MGGAFSLRWISGHGAFEGLRHRRHRIGPLPELFLEGLERQREKFIERRGIESGVSIIIPTFVGIHSTTALFRSTIAPVLEFFEHREKSIERPANESRVSILPDSCRDTRPPHCFTRPTRCFTRPPLPELFLEALERRRENFIERSSLFDESPFEVQDFCKFCQSSTKYRSYIKNDDTLLIFMVGRLIQIQSIKKCNSVIL